MKCKICGRKACQCGSGPCVNCGCGNCSDKKEETQNCPHCGKSPCECKKG